MADAGGQTFQGTGATGGPPLDQLTEQQRRMVDPILAAAPPEARQIGRLTHPEFGGGFLGREALSPEVLQMLQQQAMGQAPSAAEQLMRAALGQQQAGAFGLGASAQGMSPGLAMRQAQQAAGQAGLQSQAQFGAMRAEEMARAQAAYSQAALQQQAMNDAAALGREQLLTQLIGAQLAAGSEDNSGLIGQIVGGIGGVAATVGGAMMSDRELKVDIQEVKEDLDTTMDALQGYSFEYIKTETLPPGPRVGVMAQDLEKTDLGRRVVVDTPSGKGVDLAHAVGLALAAVSRLNERLSVLEKRVS